MARPIFGITATNEFGFQEDVPGRGIDASPDTSSPRTSPREAAPAAPPFPRKYVSIFPWSRFPSSRDSRPPRPYSSSVCGVLAYVRTYVRTRWSRGLRTHASTNHSMVWESWRGGQAAQDPPGSSSGLLIRPARPHPPQARTDPGRPLQGQGQDPPTWPGDRHAHPPQGMGIDFTSTGER